MRWRYFAGEYDLKSHADGPAAGLQADVTAESVGTESNDFRGFHERRVNVCPAPELRLYPLAIVTKLPVAAQSQRGEFFMEGVQLFLVIRHEFSSFIAN